MKLQDIENTPWSDWQQAPTQVDALRRGQRIWPGALMGQGPNVTDVWYAIDPGAEVRVIEIKFEDDTYWVRTKQRPACSTENER